MRGNTLLRRIKGAHPIVEKNLRKVGVEIHYNCEYEEGKDMPLPDGSGNYAYILDCKGYKTVGP